MNHFIIVGDYDTNRLAAAVNQKIAEGYIPNGGLFYYNTRFNQQMMTGECHTPYFIVDATNGDEFSEEVNRMIMTFSPDAAGLGETMEVNSRFIQAYGCEYAFGGPGDLGRFYKELTLQGGQVIPAIIPDAGAPYTVMDIGASQNGIMGIMGRDDSGEIQLKAYLQCTANGWIIGSNRTDVAQIASFDNTLYLNGPNGYSGIVVGEDHISLGRVGYTPLFSSNTGTTVNGYQNKAVLTLLADGSSNLVSNGNTVMSVTSGETAVSGTTSASLKVGNNGVTVTPTTVTTVAGNCNTLMNTTTFRVNTPDADGQILLGIGNYTKFMATKTVTSMDFSQVAVTAKVRMDNTGLNLETLSNAPVTIRSNNVVSLVANNGTTTLSGTNGSVVANASGVNVASSTTVSSTTEAGFNKVTRGEYMYKLDDDIVFFSSGDITRINTVHMGVSMDDGAGVVISSTDNYPIVLANGPVIPGSTSKPLGVEAFPWSSLYLDGSTPNVVQRSTGSNVVPAAIVAKMANLTPKMLNGASGSFGTGYLYEDVITAFGTADALMYGLAWTGPSGEKVVNPASIMAMEALYIRSQLP